MRCISESCKRVSLKSLVFLSMFLLGVILLPNNSQAGRCEKVLTQYTMDIRVWLDGQDDVYRCEDDLVFYVRAARDCYATVFIIDTEGFLHILYPLDPWEKAFIRGGVVYRFSPSTNEIFYSSYPRGIAYIFAVASPMPFVRGEFGGELLLGRYAYRIYGDPFVACKLFYLSILPEWVPLARIGISFSRFYIRTWEPYPRYLCKRGRAYGFGDYEDDFTLAYRVYRYNQNNPYRVLRPTSPLSKSARKHAKIVKVAARSRKFRGSSVNIRRSGDAGRPENNYGVDRPGNPKKRVRERRIKPFADRSPRENKSAVSRSYGKRRGRVSKKIESPHLGKKHARKLSGLISKGHRGKPQKVAPRLVRRRR